MHVHSHTSSPNAFFVNSFILEGTRSLVLIDTQFVLSEAKVLATKIEALGKPLAAIFLTHPHPDHYNGLATILERHPGVKVHATEATIMGIAETAEPKRAYWTPIIGADYPQTFRTPDVVVRTGEQIRIDGMDLVIHDYGPAECSDNTAIALPQIDAVIVSDLVYNKVHPWLAEGRSEKWLAALANSKVSFGGASTFYAGHGKPGPASIIDNQIGYISRVRDMVAASQREDPAFSETTRRLVAEKIRTEFAGYPLEMVIEMNIESLADEAIAD